MSGTPADGFPDLVNVVVESYHADAVLRHFDADELPDRDEIVEIVRLLRELLFPGYFGKRKLSSENLNYHAGSLLIEIHARLLEQVHHALLVQAGRNGRADALTRADEITRSFLAAIPQLRKILATDVQAAFEGDPAAADTDEIIFSYPGFFATTIYRLAHELHVREVPLIPRIMSEYAHGDTGIDIHAGAQIDEYFFIDHGTGVVIGETSVIGKRVKLYQSVTLGALSTRGGQRLRGVKRHPTLEDEVTVYSGASIFGGDTVIGKNVKVR